jgi:hypothetical protein
MILLAAPPLARFAYVHCYEGVRGIKTASSVTEKTGR